MKKVFYILNLLFLTLIVFGESVFAADPPKFYFDSNGEVKEIKENLTNLNQGKTVTGKNTYITISTAGSYYIDSTSFVTSSSSNQTGYTLSSSGTINIYIAEPVTNAYGFIKVTSDTTVNFYSAAPSLEADYDEGNGAFSFNLTNGAAFTIGNYSNNDFGTINFNSGNYTIINKNSNKTTLPAVAIGSPDKSGGEINVNQAAVVNARTYNLPSTAVGTPGSNQKCTVNVSGILNCTDSTPTQPYSYEINVGGGSLTLNNQGYIASSINPQEQTNWNLKSGIVAVGSSSGGDYNWGGTQVSPWDAYVYGEVTIPTPHGVELTPPVDASNHTNSGYFGSLTIDEDAQLTLGNEDQIAQFFVSGLNSIVNNNGDVVINSINQTAQNKKTAYTHLWNNNPGSTLTVNSGATLNIWTNGFNNLAPEEGQSGSPGEVTIEGKLNVSNGGTFPNSGNLNIAEGGLISGLNNGIAGVVNNPGGTVTLDGTVTLTQAAEFENSGTLDIGPIGTVSGGTQPNLINEAGGTVTSENDTVSLLVSMGEV